MGLRQPFYLAHDSVCQWFELGSVRLSFWAELGLAVLRLGSLTWLGLCPRVSHPPASYLSLGGRRVPNSRAEAARPLKV